MCLGDVPPNPGPLKFCHLNARSILAGVDLDQHIDDQYSLLDDIYASLVYTNDFDVIAISETWLKDNVREDALDLAGYQKPICKNRASGGVESFKACYKREFLRAPNPLHNVDNGGNMHQTRLRLGLSHLRAHLFQYNLIDIIALLADLC